MPIILENELQRQNLLVCVHSMAAQCVTQGGGATKKTAAEVTALADLADCLGAAEIATPAQEHEQVKPGVIRLNS